MLARGSPMHAVRRSGPTATHAMQARPTHQCGSPGPVTHKTRQHTCACAYARSTHKQ
jgi:hypothetical protein